MPAFGYVLFLGKRISHKATMFNGITQEPIQARNTALHSQSLDHPCSGTANNAARARSVAGSTCIRARNPCGNDGDLPQSGGGGVSASDKTAI
jgi:hypothetical protein